jgi:hypothetical protein
MKPPLLVTEFERACHRQNLAEVARLFAADISDRELKAVERMLRGPIKPHYGSRGRPAQNPFESYWLEATVIEVKYQRGLHGGSSWKQVIDKHFEDIGEDDPDLKQRVHNYFKRRGNAH